MDNLPTIEERRRYPRRGSEIHKLLRATLEFENGGREDTYIYLVDLSEGGMRVNLEQELPADGTFHLSFDLDGIRNEAGKMLGEFVVYARVAWQKSLPGGTRAAGLQFMRVPDETMVLIRELLAMFSHYSRRMHMRLRESVNLAGRASGAFEREPWWNAETRDLSTQGLCLMYGSGQGIELRIGQMIDLKLLIEEKVHATGRVTWIEQRDDKFHAGVQFTELTEQEGRFLRRWIGKVYARSVVL